MVDANITQLLKDWRNGDEQALEQLTPLVYDRLKVFAARMFRAEPAGHTLQPTALVNEAFQNLIGADVDWQDSTHFYALSARMMRRILANYAKAKGAEKRGGKALRVSFHEGSVSMEAADNAEVLALDDALHELASFDGRKAEVLELHYFGGLTYAEIANVKGLAESTVHQDLRTAKAWLNNRLS